jgi:predicted enzyme related to lactoylglutathione lyase
VAKIGRGAIVGTDRGVDAWSGLPVGVFNPKEQQLMQFQPLFIALNSEDPDRLSAFYQDVVGLTPRFDLVPGAFATSEDAPICMIVEGHSEVRGRSTNPHRMMLNFSTDDAAAEARRLQGQGVTFVRKPYEEPEVGMFATFIDPDGNYCQLVQLFG